MTKGKFIIEDTEKIRELAHSLASNIVTSFIESTKTLGFDKEEALELVDQAWEETINE